MNYSDFKYYLWDSLREINDRMDRVFTPACKPYGLTMIQAQILLKIDHLGPLRVGDLGKAISIAGGNISSLCKKMEKRGLLSRLRDTEDERAVNVALSEEGKRVVDGLSAILMDRYSKVMATSPQEDLDLIVDGLAQLKKLLQKLNENSSL